MLYIIDRWPYPCASPKKTNTVEGREHYMTVDGRRGAVASIGIDQLLRRCVVELAASEPDE